jgi:putative PEP-CTERM system TPR-repeat lipoprotein
MKPASKAAAIAAICLGAAIGAGLTGCDQFRSFTDQEHVQRAKDFQRDGDLRATEIELKNALSKNGGNVEARLLLGEIYLETLEGASAEKELKRARELGVGADSLNLPLGRAYLLQAKYKELLDEVNVGPRATARNRAQVLTLRGDALVGLRQAREACDTYAQSHNSDAQFIEIYPKLASCAEALDKDPQRAQALMNEALSLVNQALAKSPRDFDSLIQKADLLSAMGRRQEARAVYSEALAVRKNHVGSHLALAGIDIEDNKPAEARAHIEKARKLQPRNTTAMYLAALVDFQEQKYEKARDSLQQALKANPGHVQSLVLYGAVSYSLGEYQQAEQTLSRLVTAMPGSMYLRRLLAATLLKLNQPTRALETLKPLLTETADAQTMGLAGEVFMALKDYKTATTYFEKVATQSPDSPAAQARVGIGRLAVGNVESGLAELERAARTNPKASQTDTVLIMTYMQLHQFDKALTAIDALEKKQPNSPITHTWRGGAYLGKKDLANARASFERALKVDPAFMPAAKNLAQLDLQDGKFGDARKRFLDVLAHDKANVSAMLSLADVAQMERKDGEYVEWLEKAAKADSKALEPRTKLIAHYLTKGENQKALSLAHEFQTANAQNPQAWKLLGLTQLKVGDKGGSVASLSRVTVLAPDAPQGYLDLGRALERAERKAEAREAFTKALTLDPDFMDARRAFIAFELRENRLPEALALAAAEARRHPQSPAGPLLEGDIYLALKRYAEATKAYERAYALAKQAPIVIKLHQALSLGGDTGAADARATSWLAEHPTDVAVRVYLAEQYFARKAYKDAAAQYELAQRTAPGNPRVLASLAANYHLSKDNRALATAEQAYKIQPDDPVVQDTLGWILVAQGQLPRAVELLGRAAATIPNAGSVRYHYGVALARSGKPAEARKELEAALAARQDFPEADEARAFLKTL